MLCVSGRASNVCIRSQLALVLITTTTDDDDDKFAPTCLVFSVCVFVLLLLFEQSEWLQVEQLVWSLNTRRESKNIKCVLAELLIVVQVMIVITLTHIKFAGHRTKQKH